MTKTTKTPPSTDQVNQPDHYTSGNIEVIDVLEAKLSPEEYKGFLRGNVLKYIMRADYKGGLTDIQKAQWYAKRLEQCYMDTPEKGFKITAAAKSWPDNSRWAWDEANQEWLKLDPSTNEYVPAHDTVSSG